MSLFSALPVEVLLLIFKFVERRDLWALALVSRTILPVAQEVLFSEVTIITEPPPLTDEFKRLGTGTRFRATPGGFEGLVKAFSLNPSLPSKIFHLRLLFQDRHPKGTTFPLPDYYPATELASSPFLPTFLNRAFQNLQSFELHFSEPDGYNGIYWDALPPSLCTILLKIFAHPSLKHLDLQLHGKFPWNSVTFFRSTPSLKCLRIGSHYTMDLGNLPYCWDSLGPSPAQIPLETLWLSAEEEGQRDVHLKVLSHWFSSPGCPFVLSSLKHARMLMGLFHDREGHQLVANILRPARGSLESLDFSPCSECEPVLYSCSSCFNISSGIQVLDTAGAQLLEHDPIRLVNYPNLRVLRILLPMLPEFDDDAPLTWFHHFLELASLENTIVAIKVVIHVCSWEPKLPSTKRPPNKNWFGIACLLADKGRFPNLENVTFEFEYFNGIKQTQLTLE
ncbi:hypothetical protein DL96DRAFT_1819151, partial [Flagelloscypha sp. PMI_526]